MISERPLSIKKSSLEKAVQIANKGTHCGMCKIDFLETGLCPSCKKHGFLAYWLQDCIEK